MRGLVQRVDSTVNLHACLGVGPGHRLLLGTVTPMWSYKVPMMAVWRQSPGPPKPPKPKKLLAPRQAKRVDPITTNAAAERRKKILELLDPKFHLKHQEIADRTGVCREHVGRLAVEFGQSRTNRSHDQVTALAARGRELMEANGWTQSRAALELGVSASYFNQLLARGM